MSYQFSYDEFADPTDTENHYIVQDSIVFLLDGTQQMYETNSMRKCLEAYNEVVRSKCAFNKNDKLGLVIFGTKETNCEVDNVMQLQKFQPVTVDSLKYIQGLLNHGGINKYEGLALNSNEKYPLYNAVEYCFRTANFTKTNTVSHKMIVFCTCKDDPPVDERKRVEHLVKAFKDAKTDLRVIGLTDSFNYDIFYKDLQIISGYFSNDNFVPVRLEDLEENVLHLARSTCKLPWKISPDIVADVALMNLVSTPKYPSKVKLNKSTNEILENRTVLREETIGDPTLDDSEEPGAGGKKIVTNDRLVYYKTYAGEDVHFRPDEKKMMTNVCLEPGIQVLVFKPIECDPTYHYKNTYFVTCYKDANEECRNFFRTFVAKCIAKKVMPICKVVTRSTVLICSMVPSDEDGGFYMYTIPYNNYVRDFDTFLKAYRYDEDNKNPINNKALYMFKKLTKCMTIPYDWKKFKNPKLQKIVAHLEALALEKTLSSLPPDSTRRPPLPDNLKKLQEALMNLLELRDIEASKKRPLSQKPAASKRSKSDTTDVATLARENKLDSLTVAELKNYLDSVGVKVKGVKPALIKKVKEHLGL